MTRPPLPPFDEASARLKVRAAEDAWNTREPERVALAYTPDSRWRNRAEFLTGRDAIRAFLARKWATELDCRLVKALWAFGPDRIAVRFAYESRDADGRWFRSHGNEMWALGPDGLMRERHASLNDQPIAEAERRFRWPLGARPADHPGLSDLGLRRGSPALDNPTDLAFSPAVRAAQARRGSAAAYAEMRMSGEITADLAAFVESRDSAYLATASADGQPYIQHRGGPPGFLKVLDERTIGFADFRGNRQYVTTGNLAENPKAYLFLMDYARRRRIKIWGRARVTEDPEVVARLTPEGYRAKVEQAILFELRAWDANCPQHIPQKIDAEDVARALAERDARIAVLEAEIARLTAAAPRG